MTTPIRQTCPKCGNVMEQENEGLSYDLYSLICEAASVIRQEAQWAREEANSLADDGDVGTIYNRLRDAQHRYEDLALRLHNATAPK